MLWVVSILLLRVVQQITGKYQSIWFPKNTNCIVKLFAYSGMVSSLPALVLVLWKKEFSIESTTILTASCSGLALFWSILCSLKAIRNGTMVLSAVCNAAGIVIVCLFSMIVYGEPMSAVQWLGIAILLVATFLMGSTSKMIHPSFDAKTVLWLVGAFLGNGITMLMQTVYSRHTGGADISFFSLLTFLIPSLALTVVMFLIPDDEKQSEEKLSPRLLIVTGIAALAVFAVNQLVTMAAYNTNPALLFGFANCGNTIVAALVAATMFREKITWKSAVGIVLAVFSLIAIKIF